MMTDSSAHDNLGGPPWRGARWIPVIVIAVILLSGRLSPSEGGVFGTALLAALGFSLGPGNATGKEQPGLAA